MKGASIKLIATTLLLSTMLSFSSFAGWEQSEQGWKYKDDTTNVYYLNGWYWIDGNGDNVAECYYLDENGIMSANSIVDNYTINAEGQWTVDGVVQIKSVVSNGSSESKDDLSRGGLGAPGKVGDKPVPIDPEFLQKWKEATFY